MPYHLSPRRLMMKNRIPLGETALVGMRTNRGVEDRATPGAYSREKSAPISNSLPSTVGAA